MAFKVMLIYPNLRGMNMLPPAIGLLSAVLKRDGIDVRLFDTTYYENIEGKKSDSDGSKSDRLMARPFKMPQEVTLKTTDCFDDFEKEVNEFSPDLLALSATEDMFPLGIKLLQRVSKNNILTICGGVFATFAPDLVLSYPEIDIACKGEGEVALLELCRRLQKGQRYDDVTNLWFKKKDGTLKGNPTRMVDMNDNPLIDMSIFEEARFYRPMGGKVYRMFPVETHRGCPYKCAYCNSPSQMAMYKKEEGKSYLRRKTFKNLHRELKFYKDEMKAEYLYFWADTFMSWKQGEFEEFCEIYEDIKLPFWCQTRIETVTEDRMRRLKKAGCARLSFGLEHGNDDFRKKWLQRPVTNAMMLKNFKIVNDSGIPYSVNNIMGFPHETRELAFDTIRFNRQIDATDRNAYPFTPFHGTPLRDICEKLGYITYDQIVQSVIVNGSLLDMPTFPQKEVNAIVKTFNMYVKFPESRWPEIKKAEADTPEGNRIYNELKAEFMEKFFNIKSENFEESSMGQPMNA
ncbi:MAG: B12-binding domain-containing radical SAM protein [Candidatus Omnitrophica bacterium]|nr:B12-binding domain-containing radical SAM protein [Candidatus Omnitrophota bacterium]